MNGQEIIRLYCTMNNHINNTMRNLRKIQNGVNYTILRLVFKQHNNMLNIVHIQFLRKIS